MIEKNIPPPANRNHQRRMTSEQLSMTPGESVLTDNNTANAIKAYGSYHGWITRRQKQPCGKIRVWRIK